MRMAPQQPQAMQQPLGSTLRLGYLEKGYESPPLAPAPEELQSTLRLEPGRPRSAARNPSVRPSSSQENLFSGAERSSSRGSRRNSAPKAEGKRERPSSRGASATAVMLEAAAAEAEGKCERLSSRGASATRAILDEQHRAQTAPEVLDWTQRPNRVVQKEGGVRCTVSTPADNAGNREHMPYLVRTTRIEPVSPGTSGKPPVPGKRREQIVVTEKDLRRCGGDLSKLRECNLPRPEKRPPLLEEVQDQFDLSFKTAFDQACRAPAEIRDPFLKLCNPEENREMSVNDLILNQVWFKALGPRKVTHDLEDGEPQNLDSPGKKPGSTSPPNRRSCSVSTRASSLEPGSAHLAPGDWGAEAPERTLVRRRSASKLPLRATSLSEHKVRLSTPDHEEVVAEAPRSASRRPSKRCSSRGSEDKRPTGERQVTMKFASPIQVVDDEDPRAKAPVTPAPQREAAKFLSYAKMHGENRAVWLSLHPETGELCAYDKLVGTRLESAFTSSRYSVPLAGCGKDLDGAIVYLGDVPKLRTEAGEELEVQRVAVPNYTQQVTLRVTGPAQGSDCWRFARNSDCQAEERTVELFGTELVAPPSPSLPPVEHNRCNYFINASAMDEWC